METLKDRIQYDREERINKLEKFTLSEKIFLDDIKFEYKPSDILQYLSRCGYDDIEIQGSQENNKSYIMVYVNIELPLYHEESELWKKETEFDDIIDIIKK